MSPQLASLPNSMCRFDTFHSYAPLETPELLQGKPSKY